MRAFVDPVTGKLRAPTAEPRNASSSRLAIGRPGPTRSSSGPTERAWSMLDDAFSMSVVATTGPDGALRYRCVTRRADPAAGGEVTVARLLDSAASRSPPRDFSPRLRQTRRADHDRQQRTAPAKASTTRPRRLRSAAIRARPSASSG